MYEILSSYEDSVFDHVYVKYRESYYPPTTGVHKHNYYEINFIISGNVKVFLPDCVDESGFSRIVLTRPGTPHFVSCASDKLYRRFYLLFSKEFLKKTFPECDVLLQKLFAFKGKIAAVSQMQQDFCKMLIAKMEHETSLLRKKLLVIYLLFYVSEFDNSSAPVTIPAYIMQAMVYIEEHYPEKITAAGSAKMFHIGRTTLMTNFKKYTDLTLNQYIIQCRIKNAVILLREGNTEYETAERCGFGDTSGLIRSFKFFTV